MRALSGGDLKKYLFNVRDLEASRYKQREYINWLSKQLKAARNPQTERAKALYKYSDESSWGHVLLYCLAGAAICGGLGLVIEFVRAMKRAGGLISPLIGSLRWGTPISGLGTSLVNGLIWGVLIGVGGGFLVGFVRRCAEHMRVNGWNQEIAEQNREGQQRNQKLVSRANRQAELLTTELNRALQTLKKTEDILSQYYMWDAVYPKYRGLIPITMFCEYFASGRCSELTGPNGAYNIYENEIRLDLILVKLDDIISRLDQIQENQYMLASLIQDCNKEVQGLSRVVSSQTASLSRIEDRIEVSNYYNRITAANTTYLSWLAYLKS